MRIVYPPTLDWGFMFQRPQQLACALASRGHYFFFCQNTQHIGRSPELLENSKVTLVHDWPAFKRTITKSDIILSSWGKYHDLAGKGRLLVFDHLDAFPEWDEFNRQMLAKANLVLYTSEVLKHQILSTGRSVPISYVPNACDPELWKHPSPCPAWLAKLPGPRVVFLGFPGFWVNRELIEYAAKKLPKYSFVIVGSQYGMLSEDNVHVVGEKPHSELPGILQHCQAAIIPFKSEDETARAADPIKAYEYLASGLPTIATKLPELDKHLHITQVSNRQEFAKLIADEIRQDTPVKRQLRRDSISSHTWSSRAESIENIVTLTLRNSAS